LPDRSRAVIFANGVLSDPDMILSSVGEKDLIIAADGGARLCRQLGLKPAVLIGDFDSLDDTELHRFAAEGSQVIRYPTRKDYTDLELALRHVQSLGIEEVLVIAALGARWDQTLANLLLPASEGLVGMRIRLIDGAQEIVTLRGGNELTLLGHPGDILSLIPLNGDAIGVTTLGLEYPLRREALAFGATRGLSNVLLDESATIRLDQGLLTCVLIHVG
jgi:thiamine pyrophosphokinase